MSLSLIVWKPRMLEPSNALPSTNVSTSNSCSGTVKCCQVPGMSTNLRSTIFAPCSVANCNTSSGVIYASSPSPSVSAPLQNEGLLIQVNMIMKIARELAGCRSGPRSIQFLLLSYSGTTPLLQIVCQNELALNLCNLHKFVKCLLYRREAYNINEASSEEIIAYESTTNANNATFAATSSALASFAATFAPASLYKSARLTEEPLGTNRCARCGLASRPSAGCCLYDCMGYPARARSSLHPGWQPGYHRRG